MDPLAGLSRVLIFGGSFDPPHRAHLDLPNAVRRALGFDAVAYVPAAISPFKTETPPTPSHHRLAMLRLALGESEAVRILTDELDRAEQAGPDAPPSYTVDTLRNLASRTAATMRLLIGTDQALLFHQWKDAGSIVELADPVVMLREPMSADEFLDSLDGEATRAFWKPRLVVVPGLEVSSTALRTSLALGETPGLLVEPVSAYIREHGLYRTAKPAPKP